ncbi:MAG: hypothetical protein V2A79_16185 [Planctomycetota bacterium]
MCGFGRLPTAVPAALGCVLFSAPLAQAQTRPWIQYYDTVSQKTCGLIHGANAEFVVLESTGELVKVSGPDVILSDLMVDEVANVYYGDELAGFIEFDIDADGNRALFWLTLIGPLVAIDAFDARPSESTLSPGDIRNTGCDACPVWDNPTTCQDNANDNSDGDGGGSPFAGLCGAGAGAAATLSFLLLCVGRSRRALRAG